MAVSGSKREMTGGQEFTKKVGFFEGRVIAINPTAEEFKSILGIELQPESKSTEYFKLTSVWPNLNIHPMYELHLPWYGL